MKTLTKSEYDDLTNGEEDEYQSSRFEIYRANLRLQTQNWSF